MESSVHVTKLQAADRQLTTAIRLLFDDIDAVAVHTLVGAASNIFSDLIQLKDPAKSWDRQAQEANELSPSAYFTIMRKAQNFFKHARDDPEGVLEFDPTDTEALAFWAVMNASELTPMSWEAQVFQLWYIASHSPIEDSTESPLKEAIELFGDLRGKERKARLAVGRRVLVEGGQHAG